MFIVTFNTYILDSLFWILYMKQVCKFYTNYFVYAKIHRSSESFCKMFLKPLTLSLQGFYKKKVTFYPFNVVFSNMGINEKQCKFFIPLILL